MAARSMRPPAPETGCAALPSLILAGVLLQRGEWGPAEEQAHQAYHLLEGRPLRQIAAQTLMVRALLAAGRYAEASVQADALQHVMDSWGGAGQPEVAARVAIAEAFEADGDVPGARKSLDLALALIQRASESFPARQSGSASGKRSPKTPWRPSLR